MAQQYISLILSILFFISTVILYFFGRPDKRFFHLALSLSWLAGIIFYIDILFFNVTNGHIYSSYLRLFQYMMMGSWLLMDSIQLSIHKWKENKAIQIKKEIGYG